tara:strand:+ start:524 stop:1285 length:762 start_codon:yes stop_codon:yes gene_type:complete
MEDRKDLKALVYQVAAATDRGQRMNAMIAPMYQEKLLEMKKLVEALMPLSDEITQSSIEGEWELIYSSVELFRSSPFFLAIEKALNNKTKSDLFFKLHLLQVGSFGLSTVGRVGQYLNFNTGEMISTFDTTIFGLTTIPILGWFKLLPTFGGRVITLAKGLQLKDKKLYMELEKTKVSEVPGLGKIPLLSSILMERWYPVNTVWKLLPWNKECPNCELNLIYVDDDLRIIRDMYGALFVYIRPSIPLLDQTKI